ncbi:unnamed protein product [Sphenostylis stenocarpa]|uniref:Uncharacterized protein n=1 Tax=Sphenostylis stenocarpa TaxID=92480 RepID=A0AA86VRG9_9FABA|nr:unnamed protein product [Sphenostylis stenocarpa]
MSLGEALFQLPLILAFWGWLATQSIASSDRVIESDAVPLIDQLLDGLVEIGQNEANAPSGRNMPRGGLENKSISKIERAGISLGLVKHMSQRVVSESVSDEDTAAAAEAVRLLESTDGAKQFNQSIPALKLARDGRNHITCSEAIALIGRAYRYNKAGN